MAKILASAQITVTNVDDGVDMGVNLLTNTAFNGTMPTGGWRIWGSTGTREYLTDESGKKWVHVTNTSTTENYFGILQDVYSGKFIKATPYTISFDAYGTEGSSVRLIIHQRGGGDNGKQYTPVIPVTTESKRYVKTFTSQDSDVKNGFGFMIGASASSEVYISRIKFEKGNKATDWTPAPEDLKGDKGDTGAKGDKGDTGRGIESQEYYYCVSKSSTQAPADSADWDTEMPVRKYGQYIWRKILYTYTDGTSGYGDAEDITGDQGDSGLTPYVNSDSGAVMQADRTVTITLTAQLLDSSGEDVDPDGENYVYRWWQYKDGSSKATYLGIGKELTVEVSGRLCDSTTGIFFETVESPESSIVLVTDGKNTAYGGTKKLARVVKNSSGTVTKIQYLTARYKWST